MQMGSASAWIKTLTCAHAFAGALISRALNKSCQTICELDQNAKKEMGSELYTQGSQSTLMAPQVELPQS
jgi:hypothetical protein